MTSRIGRLPLRSADPPPPAGSIEALVEAAVERAINRVLEPHLRRLQTVTPAVYTVGQAAEVLQVSDDTISRLVRRGILPRVPHLDGKVLIPREAVTLLIAGASGAPTVEREPSRATSSRHEAS
jgi:excisionase family DNA binding protein